MPNLGSLWNTAHSDSQPHLMFIIKTKQSIIVSSKNPPLQVKQPAVFPPGTQKTSLNWNLSGTATYLPSFWAAITEHQPTTEYFLTNMLMAKQDLSGWRRALLRSLSFSSSCLYLFLSLLSRCCLTSHSVDLSFFLGVGWYKLQGCNDRSLMEAGLVLLFLSTVR